LVYDERLSFGFKHLLKQLFLKYIRWKC